MLSCVFQQQKCFVGKKTPLTLEKSPFFQIFGDFSLVPHFFEVAPPPPAEGLATGLSLAYFMWCATKIFVKQNLKDFTKLVKAKAGAINYLIDAQRSQFFFHPRQICRIWITKTKKKNRSFTFTSEF